jgi:delta-aminolevulinic acid dehydratase/porphobilinogen synthase
MVMIKPTLWYLDLSVKVKNDRRAFGGSGGIWGV